MQPPPLPPRPSTEPPSIPPRPGPPSFPPIVRGPLVADGTSAQSGVIARGVKWQASGILEQGVNLPGQNVAIQNAYTISMGPEGSCCDQKGRQRTEFLSWPPSEDGETWIYKWRFHLSPHLPTSYKFFHLTQLFSREAGGFIVSLGLVHNKVKIDSKIKPPPELEGQSLPEIDAEKYWGRTTYHRVEVKWGPGGSIDYEIQDSITLEPLLRYCVQNVDVPAKGSIKFGLYRAHVCSAASAVAGDFEFSKKKK